MNFRMFENLLLELLFLNVKIGDGKGLKHAWKCSKLLQMHIRGERDDKSASRRKLFFNVKRELLTLYSAEKNISEGYKKKRFQRLFFVDYNSENSISCTLNKNFHLAASKCNLFFL